MSSTPPNPSPDSSKAAGPRRWQFSIRSGLAVVVILLLGVSHWRTTWQLNQADLELKQLRRETGYLKVADKSQIHALLVPTNDEFSWKFKLYLPPGRRYRLNLATTDIYEDNFPAKTVLAPLSGNGEVGTLTLELRKSIDEKKWGLRISSRNLEFSYGGQGLPEEDTRWLDNNPGIETKCDLQDVSQFKPDAVVEILRVWGGVSHFDATLGMNIGERGSQGLLVWISPDQSEIEHGSLLATVDGR